MHRSTQFDNVHELWGLSVIQLKPTPYQSSNIQKAVAVQIGSVKKPDVLQLRKNPHSLRWSKARFLPDETSRRNLRRGAIGIIVIVVIVAIVVCVVVFVIVVCVVVVVVRVIVFVFGVIFVAVCLVFVAVCFGLKQFGLFVVVVSSSNASAGFIRLELFGSFGRGRRCAVLRVRQFEAEKVRKGVNSSLRLL